MSKENLRKAELEEYSNTKKKMEECFKEKEKSLVHLHEEFEEYKNKIIKNNNCMKEEYESNLNLLKENLEGYNEESLHKLREDLDREHAERLQAVEDKLHEEYANRMRNIKDQHKEEVRCFFFIRNSAIKNFFMLPFSISLTKTSPKCLSRDFAMSQNIMRPLKRLSLHFKRPC